MRGSVTAVLISLFSLSCSENPPPPATTASTPEEERCVPAPGVLCPVDEGPSDPSFAEYRKRLAGAIERRSAAELLPLIDPNVRTSFGNGGGLAGFEKRWQPSSPNSPLWSELEEIVNLGGSFRGDGDGRSFWAPYVYSTFPDNLDAFTHVAALRAKVPLRDQPAETGKVLRPLDWSILTLVDFKGEGWRHVRAFDGTAGWVKSTDVRGPIEYRAGFNKAGGEWKMTALVGGD